MARTHPAAAEQSEQGTLAPATPAAVCSRSRRGQASNVAAAVLSVDCLLGYRAEPRPTYWTTLLYFFLPALIVALPYPTLRLINAVRPVPHLKETAAAVVVVLLFFLHPGCRRARALVELAAAGSEGVGCAG